MQMFFALLQIKKIGKKNFLPNSTTQRRITKMVKQISLTAKFSKRDFRKKKAPKIVKAYSD